MSPSSFCSALLFACFVPVAAAQAPSPSYRWIDIDREISAVSPDGSLAASFHQSDVFAFDLEKNGLTRRLQTPQAITTILSLQFSPDSRSLVVVGQGGQVVGLPMREGGTRFSISMPGAPIQHAAASPDGKLLITAEPGAIRLWDARSGRLQRTTTLSESASHIEFLPAGEGVLLRSWDQIQLLRLPDLLLVAAFPGGSRHTSINSHAISSVAGTIAIPAYRGMVRIFSLPKVQWETDVPSSPSALRFCSGSNSLASVDETGAVLAFETRRAGANMRSWPLPPQVAGQTPAYSLISLDCGTVVIQYPKKLLVFHPAMPQTTSPFTAGKPIAIPRNHFVPQPANMLHPPPRITYEPEIQSLRNSRLPYAERIQLRSPAGPVSVRNPWLHFEYSEEGRLVLRDNLWYSTAFDPSSHSFEIAVLAQPFESIRRFAETDLLRMLDTDANEVCKLRLTVSDQSNRENATGAPHRTSQPCDQKPRP